jgi:hypothetical protein
MFISCIKSERFTLYPPMERRHDKTEFLAYLVSARVGFLRVKTADTKRVGHLGADNNGVEGNAHLINKKTNYFFSYRHD